MVEDLPLEIRYSHLNCSSEEYAPNVHLGHLINYCKVTRFLRQDCRPGTTWMDSFNLQLPELERLVHYSMKQFLAKSNSYALIPILMLRDEPNESLIE